MFVKCVLQFKKKSIYKKSACIATKRECVLMTNIQNEQFLSFLFAQITQLHASISTCNGVCRCFNKYYVRTQQYKH